MKVLLKYFLILSTLPMTSFSADIHLIEILSNVDGKYSDLILTTDDANTAVGLKLVYRDKRAPKYFDISQLQEGITLKKQDENDQFSRRVIVLQGNDFNPYTGGEFNIKYLYSGMSIKGGHYRSMPFKMDLLENWSVSHNEHKVSRLSFNGHYLNLAFYKKLIGIQSIIVNDFM